MAASETVKQDEWRAGTHAGQPIDTSVHTYTRILDEKYFELKDHLGNVRVVVTDVKQPAVQSGTHPYVAVVASYNNYYPYGMLQPERNWQADGYRYGFNGKEMDNEVKAVTGGSYDYGFRTFDPRLGSFFSTDPLERFAPALSPYVFAGSTPIWAMDHDGGFIVFYTQNWVVRAAIHLLYLTPHGRALLSHFATSETDHIYIGDADLMFGGDVHYAAATMHSDQLKDHRTADNWVLAPPDDGRFWRAIAASTLQGVPLVPGTAHHIILVDTWSAETGKEEDEAFLNEASGLTTSDAETVYHEVFCHLVNNEGPGPANADNEHSKYYDYFWGLRLLGRSSTSPQGVIEEELDAIPQSVIDDIVNSRSAGPYQNGEVFIPPARAPGQQKAPEEPESGRGQSSPAPTPPE